MLDAFIIERIRQQKEQRDKGLQPQHIHVPRPEDDPRWQQHQERKRRQEQERRYHDEDESSERGVVIIDFNL
ncbi:MAG: hypothetical protein GY884_19305 [Proteobacteria bacterium]|nr:hypothetical protein [Pseudomonadota bacterium]